MTRKSATFLVVLLVIAASFKLSAQTAPAGGIKVGILNIEYAVTNSNEGKRDFAALQKKFEPRSTELQNLNKEVEGLKAQLNTQGDKLNDDARAQLVKDLEIKQKNLQRQYEDTQAEYEAQGGEIFKRIADKMTPVVIKYAQANGFGLLLNASQQGAVIWANETVNITQAVVDQYNTVSGIAAPAAGAPAKPATGATAKPPAKPGA